MTCERCGKELVRDYRIEVRHPVEKELHGDTVTSTTETETHNLCSRCVEDCNRGLLELIKDGV